MSEPPDKHGPTSGEMGSQERAQFERRISELEGRLGKVRSDRRERGEDTDADADRRRSGMALGLRLAADLVASVLVGSAIGWGLDKVLGSQPWLFLLFFLLGFAAGVLNVVRGYERVQRELASGPDNDLGDRARPTAPDDK